MPHEIDQMIGTNAVTLRTATTADAAACVAIYRPFVEATAVSFEVVVPTEGLPTKGVRRRVFDKSEQSRAFRFRSGLRLATCRRPFAGSLMPQAVAWIVPIDSDCPRHVYQVRVSSVRFTLMRTKLALHLASVFVVQLAICEHTHAAAPTDSPAAEAPADEPESPWLLMPTFTSNPKLGTSLGALAGYLHKFDPKSQLSIFAVSAQYTSTDSSVAAGIARASFGEDHHRITGIAVGGKIKNDYDDYLGTGTSLKSEDNLRAVAGRYLYRLGGNWFVGGQFSFTNYQIVGQTALDEDALTVLGLTGFDSGGIGAVAYHDSRDIQDAPKRGWVLNANNIAYRERISGDDDFDVYRLDYRQFWTYGDRHVFAIRQSNQWTVNAPPSGFAPVQLRGYTTGEYLAQNMSSLEIEERYSLRPRWTATFFAGAACLYGDGLKCNDSENVYPMIGVGVQFVLKPAQGLVANLEYAQGEDGNNALIFKMGYAW
jgi:hypothetical protein